MTIDRITPLVEGVADMEEIKTNLSLVGADWHTKPCGRSETVIVSCEDGKYRVGKGGSLTKIAG